VAGFFHREPDWDRAGPTATNHRYNLTISMSIRNILNHNNPGPIIGNITSPLFGQANQPFGAGVTRAPIKQITA
jgi:hypothetical protein